MTLPTSQATLRRLVVGGLVLTGVIAAVAVTYSIVPTPASTSIPGVSAPTGRTGDASSAPPSPTAAADADADAAPPPSAAAPVPFGPRTSTEVEAGAQPEPGQPAPIPLPPLMTGDLPADASALLRIVAGFPSVIPIAEQSTVVASSVSSSGNRVQATLEATTTQSPASVTEYYRAVFAALSLPGTSTPASGNSNGTVFSRGGDSVTLTVKPDGDGAHYSLFGAIDVTR
jgi:hypothetical protein